MKTKGVINKYQQYAYPMQTILVTSIDKKGKANIMTVAWHTPISLKPPLYGVSIAPKRYTHKLILETEEYALNFVPYNLIDQAQFCGTKSGHKIDKSIETNLTLIPAEKIKAPIIKECYSIFECKLKETITIGDHSFIVGEIINIQKNEESYENELINLNQIKPALYLGNNTYSTTDNSQIYKF